MASGFHSEEVAHRLRELWGSFMSCASFDNPQERSKYLECFMIEFLDAYHSVKGELKRISGFGYTVQLLVIMATVECMLINMWPGTEKAEPSLLRS